MTRGEIERLKTIWDIVFVCWILFFICMGCSGYVGTAEAVVWLFCEFLLIVGGHWLAAQRPD